MEFGFAELASHELGFAEANDPEALVIEEEAANEVDGGGGVEDDEAVGLEILGKASEGLVDVFL